MEHGEDNGHIFANFGFDDAYKDRNKIKEIKRGWKK